MQFCLLQEFPPLSSGSKTGTLLMEMFSALKSECSGKSTCCFVFSLHLSNIGEFYAFFSPSKIEVLRTAWRHRMDRGAMYYSFRRYCEMTYEKHFQIFSPLAPSPGVERGKGKQHGWVCTTKAQWPVLEALPLVEQLVWGQWSRVSSAHKHLKCSSRVGQAAGATETLHCPLK